VNHVLLASLHPEQVEGELCRADELERRRGLTSELDEIWSYAPSKANLRWFVKHPPLFFQAQVTPESPHNLALSAEIELIENGNGLLLLMLVAYQNQIL
jgi:hypothetical protein